MWQPSAMRSILAGATAGAVEICKLKRDNILDSLLTFALAITYPAECTNTLRDHCKPTI